MERLRVGGHQRAGPTQIHALHCQTVPEHYRQDLKGLGDYMGWVGLGGYYHWKLSELGQLSACPHLQGKPVPDGPIGQPSGQPVHRPAQTGASASGASG